MNKKISSFSRLPAHSSHAVACQESADDAAKTSEAGKFHRSIFSFLIITLRPKKKKSCGGKTFFRLVESKLGRQNAVVGKENADEPGNGRRVNHRRMYVSTRSLHAAIIHKVHLA